jgi:hypothetical protein
MEPEWAEVALAANTTVPADLLPANRPAANMVPRPHTAEAEPGALAIAEVEGRRFMAES